MDVNTREGTDTVGIQRRYAGLDNRFEACSAEIASNVEVEGSNSKVRSRQVWLMNLPSLFEYGWHCLIEAAAALFFLKRYLSNHKGPNLHIFKFLTYVL